MRRIEAVLLAIVVILLAVLIGGILFDGTPLDPYRLLSRRARG